jgi:hypothetical protein
MRLASVLVLASAAALGGCGVLKSLIGRNTVSLENANVTSMGVDIRKEQKTICPRERVQMAVFVKAALEGEKEVKEFETWQGDDGANRNGKLEFDEFAFHSPLGKFDENGWFTPDPDVLASVSKEFELKSVYRRRPDKFSFTTTYKPDYACIKQGGKSGAAGQPGSSGSSGTSGSTGSSGSATSAGSNGGDGQPGGNGGDGSDGGPGPDLTAYATMVKTPFYEKLIAVRIEGAASDLLLLHPEQTFVLEARGGAGGPGGQGGSGGRGGSGGSGNPGGRGGNGAQGGNGGKGGKGGPGGKLTLIFDDRFQDLKARIRLDVSGGSGGSAGGAGSAGSAGSGGSGMGGGASGQQGNAGQPGQAGSSGGDGAPGTASAQAGDVAAKFAGLTDVTVL